MRDCEMLCHARRKRQTYESLSINPADLTNQPNPTATVNSSRLAHLLDTSLPG